MKDRLVSYLCNFTACFLIWYLAVISIVGIHFLYACKQGVFDGKYITIEIEKICTVNIDAEVGACILFGSPIILLLLIFCIEIFGTITERKITEGEK